MPTFCRHNRLIQNCPICSREESIEPRPVVSSSAPRSGTPREPSSARSPDGERAAGGRRGGRTRARDGVRVHRIARGSEDGYRSSLIPGLKSSAEVERLAAELSFAADRLTLLHSAPPGLYAEVADQDGDVEERTWLAFLIAYLGPTEDEAPFAAIEAARTPWHAEALPTLDGSGARSPVRARAEPGHPHAGGIPRLGSA